MYWGSGGVLLAIFKYIRLLRKEEEILKKVGYEYLPSLKRIEEKFQAALELNIDLMKEDKAPEVSFLQSSFIGLSTLTCLYLLEDKDRDWKAI